MTTRTKKTLYLAGIAAGLVFVVGLAYWNEYGAAHTVSRLPSAALVITKPFTETAIEPAAIDDTKPAPSAVIVPGVPKTKFNIRIPTIDVDASVEDVGIKASTGNIDTPRKLGNAAWYTDSAVPGEKGTAVLLGHVDNALGLAGVFKNLKELQAGDDIYITNKDGSEVHFLVTDVTNYELATAPVGDILRDPVNPVAIHIITCDKTFYGGKFHYDRRVVVTAVPA